MLTEPRWDGSCSQIHTAYFGDSEAADVVGQLSREELVQDHAAGVDVGADVELVGVCYDLFRAHVREGAYELPQLGVQSDELDVGVDRSCDAEVEDLRLAALFLAFLYQDVPRLEIAMDHSLLVGMVDGIADSSRQLETVPRPQPVSLDVLEQGPPVDELHGEVWALYLSTSQ